ncbi:TetR/AcrR family transcriptional regulator [Sphingobacterium oryzagri]|uniref:TetR/AcrR family transcriptional regulator n=1 Tax=Sphingobacterium oryzagri TaxID=3025669 RepID=A0ABY7WJC1_9SPHI|nr:TetR/AcrR family transcriptional regulator [Sphingobacterium sp. KACC 22765]WDF68380.1 TetR/AcrR family transcriptional regulator [Sphingobacterium sp. KACC 22765]
MQTKKRKEVAGPIRNKERTKTRLLDTIGQILGEETYAGLSISMICKKSGLNPKLVYLYFGSFDNLLENFLSRKLEITRQQFLDEASHAKAKNTEDRLQSVLDHLDTLRKDEVLKKMLHWAIVEKRNKNVKSLMGMYEQHFNMLLEDVLPKHAGKESDAFASLLAVVVSGMLYLSIHDCETSSFIGLNMTKKEDQERVTTALRRIIEREIA